MEAEKFEGLINLHAVPLMPYDLLITNQLIGLLLGIISVRKQLKRIWNQVRHRVEHVSGLSFPHN